MHSSKDKSCVEGLTEKGRKKELNRRERRHHWFGLRREPSAKPKNARQKKSRKRK